MGPGKNIFFLTAVAFVLSVAMATLASADFIRLLSQMQPALDAYALTLCGNRADAEDIVQEASAVMWKKLADFQPGTSFRSWAFSITYFEALAHRKRLTRKPLLPLDDATLEVLAAEAEQGLEHFEERSRALKACFGKLTEGDQKIVSSFYHEQCGLREIGDAVGRSPGALKQVLLRIRRALRICIERQLAEPDILPG